MLLSRCVFKSLLLHGSFRFTIDVICSSSLSYVIYDSLICFQRLYVFEIHYMLLVKTKFVFKNLTCML
jgi:hypothetical protein